MSSSRLACIGIGLLCVSRALLAATNGEDAPHCRYIKQAELPILMVDSIPVIDARVNGQLAAFLVDTGAGATSLNEGLADRMDLSLDQTDMEVIGIGGSANVWSTRLNSFSIDQVHVGKVTLPVVAQHDSESRIGGQVGANFLFLDDLEISLGEAKLRMFQPEHCEKGFLAYWDDNAEVIDLEPPLQGDRRPRFRVMLNGHPALAIIDTGATVSLIDTGLAKKVGAQKMDTQEPTGELKGFGRGSVKTKVYRLDTFGIGGETIQRAAIMGADLVQDWDISRPDQEFLVILGIDFLRAHRVLISINQRKLYLSYLGGKPFRVF